MLTYAMEESYANVSTNDENEKYNSTLNKFVKTKVVLTELGGPFTLSHFIHALSAWRVLVFALKYGSPISTVTEIDCHT